MSIFRPIEVNCPSCGTSVTFQLVFSVNADRRPDLRDAILDGSFQEESCTACGFAFRVEPEFSYMDMKRGQFIAVWPADRVGNCNEYEVLSQAIFDQAYGGEAPPEAQDIGRMLTPRAVFGWTSLNEKILARDAGFDDITLELAKLAVIRTSDESPVGTGAELRLLGVEGEHLALGWFAPGSGAVDQLVKVPSSLIGEIEKDAESWKEMREELAKGLFVDYRRFFIGEPVAD